MTAININLPVAQGDTPAAREANSNAVANGTGLESSNNQSFKDMVDDHIDDVEHDVSPQVASEAETTTAETAAEILPVVPQALLDLASKCDLKLPQSVR